MIETDRIERAGGVPCLDWHDIEFDGTRLDQAPIVWLELEVEPAEPKEE